MITFLKLNWVKLQIAFLLIALGVVFLMGFKKGKLSDKISEYERRINTLRVAKEIEREVESLDDESIDSALNEWLRDK